jgi:hypothetical protein
MRRALVACAVCAASFLPAALPARPLPIDAQQAQYLAQRFALAGFFFEAGAVLGAMRAAPPSCRAIVKLRTRAGDIPVCAESASRPSRRAIAAVDARLRAASRAAPAERLRLLREALAIDPFDVRVSAALSRALRAAGKIDEARTVRARADELARGRPVVWAGSK